MKINFSTILTDLSGKALRHGTPERDMTLGSASVEALLASYPGEDLKGEEKLIRFTLSAVVFNETEVDLKLDDVSLIKRLIGKAYGPLVVGRVYPLLEGGT